MRHLVPVCVALALVAAGCASTAVIRYYTLDMAPSGHAQTPVNVTIDRLRSAEALTRKDILIKKTSTEIEYYASDQWAAGIDDLVTEKLLEEFGPPREGRKTIILSGIIQSFEQVDTPTGAEGHVKLSVEFRAERYAEPLLARTYEARAAAAQSSAAGVVLSLSQCLENIAQQIAADAAHL